MDLISLMATDLLSTTSFLRKFLILLTLLNRDVLVTGQFSSLGKMQSYSGSGTGGSGSQSNMNLIGGVNGGTGNGSGTSKNPGSGEVMNPRSLPLIGEPTCEELRAMWRFSKRQSRASEITNEIPTYRDPFTYNVWLPYYPTTRSMPSPRMVPKYRDPNLPVFGRVVNEPIANQMTRFGAGAVRSRPHIYGDQKIAEFPIQGRRGQFRSGGSASVGPGSNYLTTHHGKFRELKELVLTERAKELAQQRRNEEVAARAAVLKEIANGQRFINMPRPSYHISSPFSAENRSPDQEEEDEDFSDGSNVNTGRATGFAPRKIFSGNPNSNSGRNGGVLIPSITGGRVTSDLPEGVVTQGGRGKWPSHFRERNRALFRQSGTPNDYYQRDLRSSSIVPLKSYPVTYQKTFNTDYQNSKTKNNQYGDNSNENVDYDEKVNDALKNFSDSQMQYESDISDGKTENEQKFGAKTEKIKNFIKILKHNKKNSSNEFLNRLLYNYNKYQKNSY